MACYSATDVKKINGHLANSFSITFKAFEIPELFETNK